MKKSLKKKNKIKKKTFKKGGFNLAQLNAAITLCAIFNFNKIILIKRNDNTQSIILNYRPLEEKTIQKKYVDGESMKKDELGSSKIYETAERGSLLVTYNGKVIKNNGDEVRVAIKEYDIHVGIGKSTSRSVYDIDEYYKIGGTGQVVEMIKGVIDQISKDTLVKEKPYFSKLKKANTLKGGNKLFKKGGGNEIDNLVISSCSNGSSIIATSVVTQKNDKENALLTATAVDKLLISSIKRPEDEINKLFSSPVIDFGNSENLLFLSYAWGITTLAANNLKLIYGSKTLPPSPQSAATTESLLLEGAKNNIEKATGIKTTSIPMLTL